MIPTTSPKRFLSGNFGLNIPCPEGTDGDWHLLALFNPEQASYELAGEGEGTLVNLNPSLGALQVHECSQVLRERGIATQGKVFAASHARSILEKVASLIGSNAPIDWLCQYLDPRDFLPGDQIRHLDELLSLLDVEPKILEGLQEWRKSFHSETRLVS